MYARIIVDIAHTKIDKVFDYLLPEKIKPVVGGRVVVPFGHTEVEGYVLELTETTDCVPEKIRPVIRVIEDYAVFTPEQIRLAECVRIHYHTCLLYTSF